MNSSGDKVWDELEDIYSQWGLDGNPFSESAIALGDTRLHEVFTGREEQLREVLTLFKSHERKRLLIYGQFGIGKTAFILEILATLQQHVEGILTAYISLPSNSDLATTALIALARNMADDEWAQHQLNQMGLRPHRRAVQKTTSLKVGIPNIGLDTEEGTIPVSMPQFPALSFEDLLERALEKHTHVVIAIDNLDKHDPARIRELLRNDQGMLKGRAWFILTGHPFGLTRDLLTGDLGLFDLAVELKKLDQPTAYQMLVKYLNSARFVAQRRDLSDVRAVHPFTPATAGKLCEISDGIPRLLNRYGSYILLKAAQLKAPSITRRILNEGIEHAKLQLRGQVDGLTPQEEYILQLVLEKRMISDANITLEELERVKALTFNEILPTLEKLVRLDLVRRLPTDRAAEYGPTPIMLPAPSISSQDEEDD
jgi:AAA+ ATPase superfamily predicted ATPase